MTRESPSPLPAPQRVLIVKPSALGDVVTALPVLRALRRAYPEAHLAWLVSTTCSAIIEGDPDLDEIIPFERKRLGRWWRSPSAAAALWSFHRALRRGRYAWVLDLQGLLRSAIFTRWTRAPLRVGFDDAREGAAKFYSLRVAPEAQHTVDRNIALASAVGLDAKREDMTLTVSASGRKFAEGFLRTHRLERGDFVICVPPTRWASKQYPRRHWRRLVGELSQSRPVVLLGTHSPEDRQSCQFIAAGHGAGVVDACGQTSIEQFVALIAESGGVICCDSAAKFIAPAVGVRSLVLIGPTQVRRTGPLGAGRAIVADVPCQGCLRKQCPHGTCMESIRPETVASAAREMLERGKEANPCL